MPNKMPEAGQGMSAVPVSFTSNALKIFTEKVAGFTESVLLDIGPVCGENISFFSTRVDKLYVFDIFRELTRKSDAEDVSGQPWRHLDYPPGTFDGILLWDLASRFNDRDAMQLVEQCLKIVKTGGHLMVFASNEEADVKIVNSFVIGENYEVSFRPQRHIRLPVKNRQNRDILKIMSPFTQTRSFIYRNGVREFLFRAP
jgi:hypothetical protein